MTNADALPPLVQDALEAVRDFLSTLLAGEVPLEARAPREAAVDAALEARMVLLGRSDEGTPLFVVALDQGWAPVLSEAMLGEALGAAEAADLLQEVAGQAYGAFRTQAGASGPTPPAVLFEVIAADALPALPEPLWQVSFSWPRGEAALSGAVLLPQQILAQASAEAAPEAPAAAPPPQAAPAPPPTQPPSAPAQPAAPTQPAPPPVEVARATFDDLGAEHFVGGDGGNGNLHVLSDVELEVTVELGRRRIPLSDVLRLTIGSVIELEKLVGQPLEVYANGRLIAEGEAVVIDEQFGVRVTSLSSRRKPQKAFL